MNGRIYRQIVHGEKLIADILPPPGYIVETHLYIQSLRQSSKKIDQAKFQSKINHHKKLYTRILHRWHDVNHQLYEMFQESDKYVQEYFRIVTKWVKTGGKKREKIFENLDKLFLKHREQVEKIVKYQRSENIKQEKLSVRIVNLRIFLIIVVAIIILSFVITIARYLIRKIMKYQNAFNQVMEKKKKFYAVISHDLRGPIGSISEILKYYDKFNEAEKKKMIEQLKATSQKTYNLLYNLLQWIKEDETEENNRKKCDVLGIILDTLEIFFEPAEKKVSLFNITM